MKKVTISLPTIHCESCTKLIGMTLKNIPGITKKTFDIEKKSLAVEFDASTSGASIVNAIVNDAGYEAILESEEDDDEKDKEPIHTEEKTDIPPSPAISPIATPIKETDSSIAILNIEGMHCTSCSSLIEKSLKQTPGVQEANVNFASEKARIKFDPSKTNASELQKAVANAGYTAKLQGDSKISETDKRKKELKFWFYKFL